MRASHTCPKCQQNHVLLIARVPDSDLATQHVAVVLKGKNLVGNDYFGVAGKLAAAVCRSCGYTEFYTQSPESIPVDGVHVREIVGKPPAPYR